MSNRPLCPMCRRPMPPSGRAYIVGWPTPFLICRDCWKGWTVRYVDFPSRVLRGTVRLKN